MVSLYAYADILICIMLLITCTVYKDNVFSISLSSFNSLSQTSPLVVFLVFWLWGHAQVVLGFFFSNFFNSPQMATVIGYIFVIAGVIVALVLELLQVLIVDTLPLMHSGFYMFLDFSS